MAGNHNSGGLRPWQRKDQRNAAIVRRYKQGATLKMLAFEFGIHATVVAKIIKRDAPGIMRPRSECDPNTAARNRLIVRRYYAGETQKKIADDLGLSKQAISHVVMLATRRRISAAKHQTA